MLRLLARLLSSLFCGPVANLPSIFDHHNTSAVAFGRWTSSAEHTEKNLFLFSSSFYPHFIIAFRQNDLGVGRLSCRHRIVLAVAWCFLAGSCGRHRNERKGIDRPLYRFIVVRQYFAEMKKTSTLKQT